MRPILLMPAFILPCPAFAASTMNDSGVSTTGIVTAGQATFTTSGTTWGYISSTGSYLPNLSTSSLSATTIKTSAPTATNDAATKAYVDTVVAAAAPSGPYMCATTYTSYSGNLGGVSGANTKCATDFGTGWSFAPAYKAAYYLSPMASAAPYNTITFRPLDAMLAVSTAGGTNTHYAWVNGGTTAAYSCASWTSASSSSNGPTVYDQSSSPLAFLQASCSNNYPILCCNF